MFIDVLGMCRESGLVRVGHVSLDGSKYQANASKHKAMSYGRIGEAEPRLVAEIAALLEEAERIDREEAKGATPQEIASAQAAARPADREQSNFTDPESQIMKTRTGWVQGYNAQIVVEDASGVILAEEVSAQAADSPRLVPMIDQMDANLTAIGVPMDERLSGVFSADAGYCSEANLAALEERGIDAYVATGRERHHRGGVDPAGHPRTRRRAAMREKLRTESGRAIYARRKCITEPVHGMIKQARGFRQFLLRGRDKVGAEFTLVALGHNILKLWRAGVAPALAA